MTPLPTGTVTFLFTDIEGSTRLLRALGDRYGQVLAAHRATVRDALGAHQGIEVNTEGDAFFAVFRSAPDAVAGAVAIQRALASRSWPDGTDLRVRIGIHTGEGRLTDGDYVGIDVHRTARIAAAGHGGQVLVSESTAALVGRALPDGVELAELGTYRLKDIEEPEQLSQLAIAGLPDRFPPPRTVGLRSESVPSSVTSFIGRDEEIIEVRRLLGGTRLLTLTGPGGTGKTRLALEVARLELDEFADGVHFVALDAIRDPALVASAIGQVVGVREAGRAADEALLEEVTRKNLLLVLDNFEQILPAAALVERLVKAGPAITILITSRVPLQLYGEQEYQVAPLHLPDPADLPPIDRLSQYEAVALFVDRARAVSPRFAVTDENAAAVAEICVRLDGLPLAIELAAVRVKLLSPEAILARLEHRLELLAGQSPTIPPRQRTLRGAIDWSWELLSESERRLFERLSVFSGGWDLVAAESVCDPTELGIDLLDGMASLIDNSLVRRDPELDSRFRMLQTVQEYGRERLAARGDTAVVVRRHAECFRDVAEAAEPELEGSDPARCVQRLMADQQNLRAALAWSIESGDADTGVRTAAAIWRFWQERGQLKEGRRWLDELLAMPALREGTALRAKALTAAGGIAYWQGDAAARPYYEEALAIHRSQRDAQGIADSLQNLAFTVMGADVDAGVRLFRESLAGYRELGDERNIASVAGALAYARMMTGHLDEARPAFEEALELNVRHGAIGRANDNRVALGHLDRLAGKLTSAASRYRAALVEARSIGDATRILMQLRAIGPLGSAAGRHREAVVLAGATARATDEQGGVLLVPLPGITDAADEARKADAMTDAQIDEANDEGRAMDLPAAIDFSMSLLAQLEESHRTGAR